MRGEETTATIKLAGAAAARATVLGEDRPIELASGTIRDTFAPWAVHLYQIPQP